MQRVSFPYSPLPTPYFFTGVAVAAGGVAGGGMVAAGVATGAGVAGGLALELASVPASQAAANRLAKVRAAIRLIFFMFSPQIEVGQKLNTSANCAGDNRFCCFQQLGQRFLWLV